MPQVLSRLVRTGIRPVLALAGMLGFLAGTTAQDKDPADIIRSGSVDKAGVQRLLDEVEGGRNASLLKFAYFSHRVRDGLPRTDGLAMVRAAVDAAPPKSRRWFVLQSVRGFGAFRVSADTRDEGYLAYDQLLSAAPADCDAELRRVIQRAIQEFVVTMIGDYGARGFGPEEKGGEVLGEALSVYLEFARLGDAGPYSVPWERAIRATYSSKRLQPIVDKVLQQPGARRSYAVLRTAATVWATEPKRAAPLLREARRLVPAGDRREERALLGDLVSALRADGDIPGALAAQKECVRVTGLGRAGLAEILVEQGDQKSVDALVSTLVVPDAPEVEVIETAETLIRLYRSDKERRAHVGRAAERLLSAYLAGDRARDTAEEIRARIVLAELLIDDGRVEEAARTLTLGGYSIPPSAARARYLHEMAIRRRKALLADPQARKE